MSYAYSDTRIIVFAKAPVAGQVKTRLNPDYSAEHAAQIHANLVHHTLAMVCNTQLCPVELWCAPYPDHPFFDACAKQYSITLKSQQGDDLGERMFNAIEESLQLTEHVIVIGTDCPTLEQDDLEEAIDALHHEPDICISPARDGGYVLIGLTKNNRALFDGIHWGSDEVMMQTLERLQELNYSTAILRPHSDIDYASDINNLDDELRTIALNNVD